MLRGFSASLAAVFTCSQHVWAFTLPHLKHVTCSRYAPSCSGPGASASHCCSAGTLGLDRACIRPRPSWTSGSDSRALWNILWNICSHFSFSLLGHTGLLWHSSLPQQHFILVRLLLALLLSHGQPCLFLHGSLGPNLRLFFFPHVLLARVSSTTSNDFNANFSPRITTVDPSMEPAQF